MSRATNRQEAQRKRVASTPKYKKLAKRVAERDLDPEDNTSDREIMREMGFSDNTKRVEVMESPSFKKALTHYYKNHKTPQQVADRLAQKARRNLDEGMDSADSKMKLEYTKLQFKREDAEAMRTKVEIKDSQGNLLTLFGMKPTDEEMLEPEAVVTEITEIDDED